MLDILSFGRARDSVLVTCARNSFSLTFHYNISLMVSHVQGRGSTVADLLSRWPGSQEDNAR